MPRDTDMSALRYSRTEYYMYYRVRALLVSIFSNMFSVEHNELGLDETITREEFQIIKL